MLFVSFRFDSSSCIIAGIFYIRTQIFSDLKL